MVKFYRVVFICFFVFITGVISAQPFKDDHPQEYEVRSGDTLWGIAETFLRDPWLWPEIWHINTQIENPHLIYPGDIVQLIQVDGKKMLTIGRTGRAKRTELPDGTIKLSPRARVSKLDSVIPAIPLEAVQSFLVDNRVVEREELDNAPYVLAGGEGHIIMGSGDKFYVRGQIDQAQTAFGLYRKGVPFVDPDTGEFLGMEAKQLGLAKYLDTEKDISTMRLLRSGQDVRIGDRLLPTLERKVNSIFYPKSPVADITGKIIHVFGGVRNVSQYNVVVINRGEREKLAVGDVLAIYRNGEQTRDRFTNELIQLPSERSGLMIIFRTFEKVSFGLVLKAQKTLKVFDAVRNP